MSLMERFEKLLRQGVPVDLATELARLELANATRPATKQQELFPAPMPPAAMPQAPVEQPKVESWSARAEVAAGIEKLRAAHGNYSTALEQRNQTPAIDSNGRKPPLAHQNFNRTRRHVYKVAKEVYTTIADAAIIVTLAKVKAGSHGRLAEVLQHKGFTCDVSDVRAWEDGYRLPEDVETAALAAIAGLDPAHCVETMRKGREVVDEYRAELGMCKVYRMARKGEE